MSDYAGSGRARCHGCRWILAIHQLGLCRGCYQVLAQMSKEHGVRPSQFYAEVVRKGGHKALGILDCTIGEAVTVSREVKRTRSAGPVEHPEIMAARQRAADTLFVTSCEVDGWFYSFTPELRGGEVVVTESRMRTGFGVGA